MIPLFRLSTSPLAYFTMIPSTKAWAAAAVIMAMAGVFISFYSLHSTLLFNTALHLKLCLISLDGGGRQVRDGQAKQMKEALLMYSILEHDRQEI